MREQFLLDPGVAFLNQGSCGACPKPVFADFQRWQFEMERPLCQGAAYIAP